MAIQDWLGTAVDLYDQWQNRQGARDSIDRIAGGYDQGINYLQQTADESKGILGDVYDTSMEGFAPYGDAGRTALDQYMGLMSDPSTIMDDPGAQWRLQQGEEAMKRSLEQAGYADPMGSGAHPIGITEYGQGFATQELDRALARRLPPMELGMRGVEGGARAGGDYGRGITGINAYMGPAVAGMYGGRADALATKDLIDAQAMSGFLSAGLKALGIGGAAAAGAAGSPPSSTQPAQSGGPLDSLIKRATGGNLGLDDIAGIVGDIGGLSELDLSKNLLDIWQSSGIGNNFGSFLDDVFGADADSSASLDLFENADWGLLNNGTDNLFDLSIFDDTAVADIDPGFWEGLGDTVGGWVSGVSDWVGSLFR